jgi:DNA-binding transcriptional LysR family regulator
MDFRIRQLQCFLTLADLLHYGRTARALYMSQPTITFQIKSLEETFGVRLFERSRQEVSLTPAGLAFRQYAQTIVDTVNSAQRRLADLGRRHHLRLSCTEIGQEALPQVLRELAVNHPDFDLQLSELNREQQIVALTEERIDAIFMVGDPGLAGFRFDLLRDERIVLLVPRQSALAHRESVSVEALRHHRLLASRLEDCSVGQPFLHRLLAPYGIVPHIVEAPHSHAAKFAYLAAGAGLLIGTPSMAQTRPDVVALPFVEPIPMVHLGLVSMKTNLSPALTLFRAVVRQCFREKKHPMPMPLPMPLEATA